MNAMETVHNLVNKYNFTNRNIGEEANNGTGYLDNFRFAEGEEVVWGVDSFGRKFLAIRITESGSGVVLHERSVNSSIVVKTDIRLNMELNPFSGGAIEVFNHLDNLHALFKNGFATWEKETWEGKKSVTITLPSKLK